MKTKEEVIKEAWGEYYDIVKDEINAYGWYDFFDLDCKERKRKLWQFENIVVTQSKEGNYIRPKSLQGIENNNGWNEVKKDTIQYLIKGTYFVIYINGFIDVFEFDGTIQCIDYFKLNFTHYQPISKPKPPLY